MMKASIIICMLFAVVTACPAQNKKRMNYPQVSESIERIDTGMFDDDQTSKTVRMPDGSEMRYQKSNAGYSLRVYDPKTYYAIVKNYYPNGFIKEKGVSFNASPCPLGNWYFFSEEKSLQRKNNYDNGYRFDINDVIKFLNGKKIPYSLGALPAGGKHTEIFKGTEGHTPVWYIHWPAKADLIEILTLSGADGKILNRTYEKYDNS